MSNTNLSSFIWSVADLLRGDYKQSDYGKVILPFTVLRRLDCVLEPTKEAVLAEKAKREKAGVNPEPFLLKKTGTAFYNNSPLDLKKLMGDQDHIGENLRSYVQGFSAAVRDIFERFEFHTQIDRLEKARLLYLVTEKFANIDLHPDAVGNAEMGLVFEELIRRFAELSNETAGEHLTPREVIRLMVNLLFIEDDEALRNPGVIRSIYDPTAGTGGMLSVAAEHLAAHNPEARPVVYGQELNPESYAICKADMLIKGQDVGNIVFGNTLSHDGLDGRHFDSRAMRSQIERAISGADGLANNLPQSEVLSFFITVPPLDEQKRIAESVAAECAAIDSLAVQIQSAIDLLLERRAALVSAAVTGRIDVRHLDAGADTAVARSD